MFNSKAYIFNNYDIPAKNGAVVLYKEIENPSKFNLRRLLGILLLVVFTAVSTLQINWISVHQALAEDLPISAPLTSPEVPQNPEPPKNPGNSNPGNNNNNNGNNSGGSNNGGGGGGAPSCNDSKPGFAPRLVQAQVIGNNQVKLTWTKSLDPVTHYLLSFGVKSNTPLYGDPNIGNKNVTTYVVGGLQPNATYFFKVSAVNGCTPGDASNELAVRVKKGIVVNAPLFFQLGNQAIKQGSAKNIKPLANISKPSNSNSNQKNTEAPDNSNKKPESNIFKGIGSFLGKFMNFMSDPAYN